MQSRDGKMRHQTQSKSPNPCVIFWNCASGVYNKKPYIEKYIQQFNPTVFFISECDVKRDHNTNLLKIQGFELEVAGTVQSKNKGRVLAYVKNGSEFQRARSLEAKDCDLIALKRDSEVVVGVYVGFKTDPGETVITNFERLLSNLSGICEKFDNVLIGGDFNADLSRIHCPKSKRLYLWQIENGLDQHVSGVTRIREVSGSIQQSQIDQLFSKAIRVNQVDLHPSEVSDHLIVVSSFTSRHSAPPIFHEKKIVIDWRNFNPNHMCNLIRDGLKDFKDTDSVEVMNRNLVSAITVAMNKIIPKRVVHTRRSSDLVNYHVEAIKKKRDRMFKSYRKTGSLETLKIVKDLNLQIKRVIKKERQRTIKAKMKDSSPKTFWHTVNTLLGQSTSYDAIVLKDKDGFLMNEDEAAQSFADFFRSKVDQLVGKNPIEDLVNTDQYEAIRPFTDDEVETAVSNFRPKKSHGPDEIPMAVIKLCFSAIRDVVGALFRKITDLGRIPRDWKMACVKPIHKKGPKDVVTNYRPISNLNSLSKIFERCMLNRISGLETDGPNQHGFKSCHSTVTAGIELQDHLALKMDLGMKCLVYSMDLSAAFDLIRPGIFLRKALKVIPEKGIAHLMYEFITERKAYVQIGQSVSSVFGLSVVAHRAPPLVRKSLIFTVKTCIIKSLTASSSHTPMTPTSSSHQPTSTT
jgi:hypothetical protein